MDGSSRANKAPSVSIKTSVIEKGNQCWLCSGNEDTDQNALWVCPWSCDGTLKFIHQLCLQLYIKEKKTGNLLGNVHESQYGDVAKPGSNSKVHMIEKVKGNITIETSIKILSEVRYYTLKKLLLKSCSVLAYEVGIQLRLEKIHTELENVWPKKDAILWDLPSVLKFLNSCSYSSYYLEYLEDMNQLTESLEEVKNDIDSNKYMLYYNKIESLLLDMGVLPFELRHFNPMPAVPCDKKKLLSLGWSKEIYEGISACKEVSQIVQLSFGEQEFSRLSDEAKDYIRQQVTKFEGQQPALKKMIRAAKLQDERFGNGTKLVIMLCACLVEHIPAVVLEGLSPDDLAHGYNLFLGETLQILESLCNEMDDAKGKNKTDRTRTDDSKCLPGAGASEIELYVQIKSFAASLKNKETHAVDGLLNGFLDVPKALLENNGLCSLDIIVQLEKEHLNGRKHLGCDVKGEYIGLDSVENQVLDYYLTKRSAIELAVNAACSIIKDYKVDPTVENDSTETLSTKDSRRINRQSISSGKSSISPGL